MSQIDANLDGLIKKNFPGDIQFKRVKREITHLKELSMKKDFKISILNSVLGLKIIVEVTKECLQENGIFDSAGAQFAFFEILIESKFPFVFPMIFCRTDFTEPTIADGRDLLSDIIQNIWSPSILLYEIVQILPDFIARMKVCNQQNNTQLLQTIGQYHLGHFYCLDDFLVIESIEVFPANELLNDNTQAPRYVMVSQCNILSFEIIDKKKNIIKLITWANMQSLLNIKRKKEQAQAIILTWRFNQQSEKETIQIYQLENSSKFIELVIDRMQKFGIKAHKNVIKTPHIKEEEVTKLAYKQFEINQLLENIMIMESRLNEELTINIVQTLMKFYQDAVEYYSAMNDDEFTNYMDRLHQLLNREDVKVLMMSTEDTSHNQQPRQKEEQKHQEYAEPEQTIQKAIQKIDGLQETDKEIANLLQQNKHIIQDEVQHITLDEVHTNVEKTIEMPTLMQQAKDDNYPSQNIQLELPLTQSNQKQQKEIEIKDLLEDIINQVEIKVQVAGQENQLSTEIETQQVSQQSKDAQHQEGEGGEMLEGLQANSNQGKEDVSYPEIKKRKKKAIQK